MRVSWRGGERVRSPRPARVGLLCLACRDHLADMLAEVEQYAGMLDEVRERGVQDEAMPGIKIVRADAPAPCNLGVLAVEDRRTRPRYIERDDGTAVAIGPVSITATLSEWAELIRDLRCMSRDDAASVPELVAFLSMHVDWCAGHSWVVDMYAELDELHRQLGELVGEPRPRPVGSCPDCWAPLWPPAGDVLACGRCGASWDRSQWSMLAAVLEQQAVAR